jgi:SOS response regulatory protein OraA/RecX
MIEIKSFRAADGGSVILCEIKICDEDCNEKRTYRLLPEQYKELRLKKGEISEGVLSEILDADELCRALRSGRSSLAHSASSEAALKQKLRMKGFSARSAERAVEILVGEDAITEEEDAVREAERCLKKLWGKNRIAAQLRSKGYRRESVDRALLSIEDTDFSVLCRRAIEKKWGTLPKNTEEEPTARDRAVAALLRLGFTMSEINQATKQ